MSDLNRSIKIFIDGSEATQSVEKVEAAIAKLEKQLGELSTSEADYQRKSDELKKELERKNRTLENYKKKIAETQRVLSNLSGATYDELISVQRTVRQELRKLVPGTERYNLVLEQNRQVSEAVARAQAAMRVEVGNQGSMWSKAAGFLNKYMTLIGGVVASLTGISMTMRRSVNDYAQISEAMAGVKKYTGMADDEIKELNEDFQKMDTRTSRERLNELAQDAGRLGIQGREAILEFVDAANVINVALGEDLGKDAVKNIGKLSQMFGDDKRMGLRGAMLATASAINEVAQNSSAAEKYLVEFTARIGGTGKQAGISQTQIMGFASVLDQDMQNVEMSATALQNTIMKAYQEPAKFAKVAGMDVKAFTKLMRTDANAAILKLLENIKKMGGLSETATVFKDMGLDGSRASGVLNTLADKVDKVRAEQERATSAYQEGTSVLNEYAVQNNTVQAGLDKAKKKFQEIVYEMGEKLAPSMGKLIATTGDLIRLLAVMVQFIFTNKTEILLLTAIIGSYIVGMKLEAIWLQKNILLTRTKVSANALLKSSLLLLQIAYYKLTGQVVKARAATIAFHTVSKLNPAILRAPILLLQAAYYNLTGQLVKARAAKIAFHAISSASVYGLITVAVTALAAGYLTLAKRMSDYYNINVVNEKITARTNELVQEQQTKIDKLTGIIHNNKKHIDKRREAIQELQKIIPGYNAEITKEGTVINENTTALKKNNAEMALSIELNEINEELLKRRREVERLENHSSLKDNSLMGSTARFDVQNKLEREKKVINSLMERYEEAHKIRDRFLHPDDSTSEDEDNHGGKGNPNNNTPDKNLLKDFDTAHQDRINEIRLKGQEEQKAEAKVRSAILTADKEYYTKRISLLAKLQVTESDKEKRANYKRESVKSKSKLLDTEVAIEQHAIEQINKLREEELLKQQEQFNKETYFLQSSLEKQEITKEQFAFASTQTAINNAEAILAIEKEAQTDILALEFKNNSIREKALYDSGKRLVQAERETNKQRLAQQKALSTLIADFKGEFKLTTPQEELNLQLTILEAAYQAHKELAKRNNLDTLELDAAYETAKANITQEGEERILQIRAKYGLDVKQQQYDLELAQLKKHLKDETLTHKEYLEAKRNLDAQYDSDRKYNLGLTAEDLKQAAKGDMLSIKKVFDFYAGLLSDAVNSLKDAELANIDAKYDAEIEAAQGNAEEVERLETEKAQKKLDIEKKYADVQFAIKASQILADTAVAIMVALKELGPIAGPVAAAFMGVTGAAQLAVAAAERNKVKQMTLSGSSSTSQSGERIVSQRAAGNYDVIGEEDGKTYRNIPYIGEPTTGIVRRTSLISENGAELIVNAEDLSRLQRHINYPVVLQAINDARIGRVPQRAAGNYGSIPIPERQEQHSEQPIPSSSELVQAVIELRKAIQAIRMLKAYILFQDIENAQKTMKDAQKPFTRGDK